VVGIGYPIIAVCARPAEHLGPQQLRCRLSAYMRKAGRRLTAQEPGQ
jgi:hypothetical protein